MSSAGSTSQVPQFIERSAVTDVARAGLAHLRELPAQEAWWLVMDTLVRRVVPTTLEQLPSTFTHETLRREAAPLRDIAQRLRQLDPLKPSSVPMIRHYFLQATPLTHSHFLGPLEMALEEQTYDFERLVIPLLRWPGVSSSGHFLTGANGIAASCAMLEALGRARRFVARLHVENLAPDRVQILGLTPENTRELNPLRPVTFGKTHEADVQVVGAQIGGRRNCTFSWNERRGWELHHLGHSCPIYVNGRDISRHRTVPLRDGDGIEPVAEPFPVIRIRFAGPRTADGIPALEPQAWEVVIEDRAGHVTSVRVDSGEPLRIGRERDGHVVLGSEAEGVSPQHCDLSVDDDGRLTLVPYAIETWLRDERAFSRTTLQPREWVRIGRTRFRVNAVRATPRRDRR